MPIDPSLFLAQAEQLIVEEKAALEETVPELHKLMFHHGIKPICNENEQFYLKESWGVLREGKTP